MEIKSEQKYLIISPRKLRPVADIIRKLSVQKAIDLLPFVRKRGSSLILKVIKSAVANASQKGIGITDLEFKEIQIGEGPRLRRGQPVSRGRWHPIKKRMSHIRVILEKSKKATSASDKTTGEIQKKIKKTTKKIKTDVVMKKKIKKKGEKNGTKS